MHASQKLSKIAISVSQWATKGMKRRGCSNTFPKIQAKSTSTFLVGQLVLLFMLHV